MARKKQRKIIEAGEIIKLFKDLDEDLEMLVKRKRYLENFSDSAEALKLLLLFESKIEKRRKYLEELLKKRMLIV